MNKDYVYGFTTTVQEKRLHIQKNSYQEEKWNTFKEDALKCMESMCGVKRLSSEGIKKESERREEEFRSLIAGNLPMFT